MGKKKYKIGMYFGCQKCLFCGINLGVDTCKCKKSVKPTRSNRTVQVKSAFPRSYNPTTTVIPKQLNFIKNKNESFEYGFDLRKNFQFSLCSKCNSSYQHLSKDSNTSNKSNLTGRTNTETEEIGETEGMERTDIVKINKT